MITRQRGWLFALSSVPLSALFSFLLASGTASIFRHLAISSLISDVEVGLYRNASELLEISRRLDHSGTIPHDDIAFLLKIGQAVTRRDTAAIDEAIAELPQYAIASPLEVELKKFLTINEQAKSERKILAIPADSRESLTSRYKEVRADLGSLLSISSLNDTESFSFYSGGVFAELPVLSSIPRSPASLEELKSILDRLGGGVRIPGDEKDPKGYFLSKLEKLRSDSRSIQSRLTDLGINIASLHRTSKGITSFDRVEDLESQITSKIQRIISGIAHLN